MESFAKAPCGNLVSSANKLDNLCLIIDDNDSVRAMVPLTEMKEKLGAFGFDVDTVNGHDMEALENSLKGLMKKKNGRPKALIAKTVRGYGSKTLTENDIWFHKAPNTEELISLQKEVNEF